MSAAEQSGANTDAANEDSDSAKGLKAGAMLILNGGSFDLDTSDDALHSNGTLSVSDGNFTISTGDDALHADAALTILDGTLVIEKSYEGIEGLSIAINGGDITLVSSDDGLNAAGGNDGSSLNGRPGQNNFSENGDCFILISGGSLNIDASGDGIDSNGNLTVTGGTIFINGPTSGADGALDYAGTASISGGTVVAAGASGMAAGFDSSSTQCSILYTFSSALSAGDTIALTDASGNELVSYTPTKQYQSVVISVPEMLEGQSYLLTAGSQTVEIAQSAVSVTSGGGQMGGMAGGPGMR